MDERSDEELVADYLEGNEDSFRRLAERYFRHIYNFAARLAGKTGDAEDIVQETFVKVWKNLRRFKSGRNFKTWLFTIARNTAYDHLRKKQGIILSDFDGEDGRNRLADSLPDEEPLPDEIFARAEDAQMLENAISELAVIYRETLILHYAHNLTFDEISKIIGAPIDTVKSRHRRALLSLKKTLGMNNAHDK